MKNKVVLYIFYGRSGMWHYATQYANGLSKFKKVLLVCPDYSDKKILKKDIDLFEINTGSSISGATVKSFIFSSLNIIQHIKIIIKTINSNSKIIHFLDNHPWSIFYGFLFKLLGFRIIITQHDPIQHSGEPRSLIQNTINKIQRILADYLIVFGEFLKDQIIKKYNFDKDKIIVFHIGNFEFIKLYENKDIKEVREEKNTFLFFGRIIKYKGLDLLLDALKILKQRGVNFKLIIAGNGDLSSYEKDIVFLKDNLEIHNRYLKEEEIPYFFKRSSFVVLPYKDGTQTGIIPIAYAYKKPVIVTDVGSLPEVVDHGKTGLIVKRDPEEIANAIENLLNRNDLKEMGEEAYNKMKEMLDWGKNISKILSMYD